MGYPLDRVYEEVAHLARNLHWTRAELLAMDHAERRRWMLEIVRQDDRGEY